MVDVDGKWSIGAYYQENIDGLRPLYQEKGWPLLYACDGLTLAIPQYQVLSTLRGRTLDRTTDGYVVR